MGQADEGEEMTTGRRVVMGFQIVGFISVLLVLLVELVAHAGEPGPDDAYIASVSPPVLDAPHPVDVWQEDATELPRLYLELHGGPGQNATVGGQMTYRPAWSHGARFGIGLDWVAGDGIAMSQSVTAECSSSSGHRPTESYSRGGSECSSSATQTLEDRSGATLFQAVGEFHVERDWLVQPYVGAGVGVLDRDLAWSATVGALVPIAGSLSGGISYRVIDANRPGNASHGALFVVRVGAK